jgi:hypothetical protein
MKHIFMLILLCLLSCLNLPCNEMYQKGILKLTPDDAFARNLDWSKLFIANFPSPPKPRMETHESMALAPDNTIYVVEHNNLDRGRLVIIGPGGTLQGVKPDASGQADARAWSKTPYSAFVTGNNELWINEWRGLARCDRQGRVLEITTKVDHAVSDFLLLNNGTLAISGWVVTGRPSTPLKLSASLVNIRTAKETVITSYDQNPYTIAFTLKPENAQEKGGLLMMGTPAKTGKMMIAATPEGRLIVGYSDSPEIQIFSPEGKKVGGFTLPIQRQTLNLELKMHAVQRVSKSIDSLAASGKVPPGEIERGRKKLESYPIALPYYSSLLVDDQGNLLFFLSDSINSIEPEIMVFSQSGKAMGTCRLALPQGITLRLDRPKQMVIRNGWLYALVHKDIAGKKQVQLARFKIE